ncbi:MAG: hypothetical protein V1694_06515 [Candidatus Eisenbacteria bacterium]
MEAIVRWAWVTYCARIVLCVGCILAAPIWAAAGITSVEVIPSAPTVNDIVTVRVSGDFNDGCWDPGLHECGAVAGFTITPTIWATDSWQPGGVCPMMMVPYFFSCEYGRLEAGHYVVTVTEEHRSLRDPFPDVFSVEFDVVMPPAIEAAVDIDPGTLNLGSMGRYVTCYIELPEGYDPAQIDISGVKLNEAIPAETKPAGLGDYDGDGIPDLMVKFSRSAVIGALPCEDNVEVRISGEVSGELFRGLDTIRVLCK